MPIVPTRKRAMILTMLETLNAILQLKESLVVMPLTGDSPISIFESLLDSSLEYVWGTDRRRAGLFHQKYCRIEVLLYKSGLQFRRVCIARVRTPTATV